MSSSARNLKSAKPRHAKSFRHTAEIELDNGIKSALIRIKQLELSFKLYNIGFQIRKMAEKDTSLSLLEPITQPMSQIENEDGTLAFKCNSCPQIYKQLKRLQTHLASKHGIIIDLDETVNNFSPTMVSTHEDAIGAAEDEDKSCGEPTKIQKKRGRESDDEDEDPEAELAKYRRDREKRAKVLDDLAKEFVSDIGDKTMEDALEAVERSGLATPGETQAMTDQISQKIREAERAVEIQEGKDDSAERDEKAIITSLQSQLELKDNLLNIKESRMIDLEEKIARLEAKLDEKDHILKNKKLLVKEKDKEIKDLTKKAKCITKAAGKSPSKEELKDRCRRFERTVENLTGRLKNLENSKKDSSVEAKLEQTIKVQIKEIEMIKESLSRFEAKEVKLMKKIPCEQRPCPFGRKKCQYSHDLEYKTQTTSYKKSLLCKYFAGSGCNLPDDQCEYSHSLELAVRAEQSMSATGGNQQALGARGSYRDSFNNSNMNRSNSRNVSTGANNNMSVEIIADLSKVPPNDARRTIIQKRTPKKEDMQAGNGQGSSSWRPRQEDPRERPRSHRSVSTGRRFSEWNRGPEQRDWRGQYERDPRDNGYRSSREGRRY